MLETSRLLDFCITNNLDVEEYTLLNNLYLRNEQINPELFPLMDKYYRSNSSRGRKYVQMIKDLEKRGFLETLKDIEEESSIEIKNLRISDSFSELLYTNPEEVWEKVYTRYPSTGEMDGKFFIANMLDKDDKDYFLKHILKNGSREEASRILYILEDMFDFHRGKPTRNATVGISKFLRNYKEIVRQWEEGQSSSSSDYYNRLM